MKKYYIDNECMIDFIDMYCEGKSYLWNLFLVGDGVILEMIHGFTLFI